MNSKLMNYILLDVGLLLVGAAAYLLYKQSEDDKVLAELKDEVASRTDQLNEASDRLKAIEAMLEKRKPGATVMSIVPPEGNAEQKLKAGLKGGVKSSKKSTQKPAEKAAEKQD